jgi:hypothetical protein
MAKEVKCIMRSTSFFLTAIKGKIMFKIGEKVRVINHLPDRFDDGLHTNDYMKGIQGKFVTISSKKNYNGTIRYIVRENGYSWSNECFVHYTNVFDEGEL